MTEEIERFIETNLVNYLNISSRTIPGYEEVQRTLALKGPISTESYLELNDFFFQDSPLRGVSIYICFHDQIPGQVETCRPFDSSADLPQVVQMFRDQPAEQNGDESCLMVSTDFERVYLIENSRDDGKATVSYLHRAKNG